MDFYPDVEVVKDSGCYLVLFKGSKKGNISECRRSILAVSPRDICLRAFAEEGV